MLGINYILFHVFRKLDFVSSDFIIKEKNFKNLKIFLELIKLFNF